MPAELATSLTSTDEERLEQAEADVRDYCGWHIAPNRDETITVDGSGGRILDLPSLHVTAVASVTEDGTLLEPTSYVWRDWGVIERVGCAWGTGKVEVELSHGYTPVPPNITAVVQAIASRAIGASATVSREQVGQVSRSYLADGLSAGQIATLDHYRIRLP